MTRQLFITALLGTLSFGGCQQPASPELNAVKETRSESKVEKKNGPEGHDTDEARLIAELEARVDPNVPDKIPNPDFYKDPDGSLLEAEKENLKQASRRVLRSELLNVAMGGHEVGTLVIKDEEVGGQWVHTRKSDLAIKRGELTLKLQAQGVSKATLKGEPISFKHVRSGASGDAAASGIVKEGELIVTTMQAGAKTVKTFPAKDLYFAATLEHLARSAKPGERFVKKAYVEELGAVVNMEVSVEKEGAGKKITTKIKTLETVESINKEGALLISRTPALGSLAYPKGSPPPGEIKAGSVDVLAKSVWPAPALSKDEKRVLYRVQTPDSEVFAVPEDLRQKVIARTNKHVDIEVVAGPSTNAALSDAEKKRYLEETAYEPVKDKRIVDAALKNSASAKSTKAKISALVNFVHDHVDDKALDRGYAAAPLTLESKRGDCTEHSVLLSALLRSIKIPTRLVDGVVLTGGHVGYHEWVEVYVEGEGFIPADPTFGEFPATPLRLKLAEGASSPEGLLELGVAAGRLLRPGVKVMVLSPQ